MIRPNFHIWVLLVVPGTRWRWMRHGLVGSNGNQLTPKSFSASSSPSLSSSSITQSPRLLLNQRSGWRMDIRHAKSVHINTNATLATWELAPKKCIKRLKLAQNTLHLHFHRDVLVPPPPCRQCEQQTARCYLHIWLYFHYCYYYHYHNYHYNNDWWAGCGVIEEDLLDQVPSRTKRQQPDQGRNGPILAKLERWLGLRAGGKNNNWNYKTLPKAVRTQASTALISSFGLVW